MIFVGLRPDPVPRSLGTIPRDRGFRDGFPRDKRDNLSNLIINTYFLSTNKYSYIVNVHIYINTKILELYPVSIPPPLPVSVSVWHCSVGILVSVSVLLCMSFLPILCADRRRLGKCLFSVVASARSCG